MKPVYIIDGVRTAIGKYGGTLSSIRPDDLLATTLKAILVRNPTINVDQIEEVITGAANQSGEDNRNVARMALLLAGLPITVAGVTVNRLCASGMQSIMDAARAINNGDGTLYIASGVESMSRAPYVMGKAAEPYNRTQQMYDTTMGWRFVNPTLSALYHPYTMGETAENVAQQWNITRAEQDEYAHQSQVKYAAAHLANKYVNELIAVPVSLTSKEIVQFIKDEHPRLSSVEKLTTLQPAFVKNGTVTAGNSSGINDGAAAMLLANDAIVTQLQLQPMASIIGMAVCGVAPSIMGIGPVTATHKALQRAGLTIADIGIWEINEAFASQSIACIRELQIDPTLVNVTGGAIALGHPLGCSGTRISITLINQMKQQQIKYGVATMCVGVGQGAAVVYELL